METLTYSGQLVIISCWCGIRHAVPESLRSYQLREKENGRNFAVHCPLGHEYWPAGETRADVLEKQLKAERERTICERAKHDQTKAELKIVERQKAAVKGQLTKTRKRHAAGVCPCCNRQFQQLVKHMKTQHPNYSPVAD